MYELYIDKLTKIIKLNIFNSKLKNLKLGYKIDDFDCNTYLEYFDRIIIKKDNPKNIIDYDYKNFGPEQEYYNIDISEKKVKGVICRRRIFLFR